MFVVKKGKKYYFGCGKWGERKALAKRYSPFNDEFKNDFKYTKSVKKIYLK